jgi:hypothetical protein
MPFPNPPRPLARLPASRSATNCQPVASVGNGTRPIGGRAKMAVTVAVVRSTRLALSATLSAANAYPHGIFRSKISGGGSVDLCMDAHEGTSMLGAYGITLFAFGGTPHLARFPGYNPAQAMPRRLPSSPILIRQTSSPGRISLSHPPALDCRSVDFWWAPSGVTSP